MLCHFLTWFKHLGALKIEDTNKLCRNIEVVKTTYVQARYLLSILGLYRILSFGGVFWGVKKGIKHWVLNYLDFIKGVYKMVFTAAFKNYSLLWKIGTKSIHHKNIGHKVAKNVKHSPLVGLHHPVKFRTVENI